MKSSRRYKVECTSCGAIFNHDYKSNHEQKVHGGKAVITKIPGAPKNPFEAAKRRRIEENENVGITFYIDSVFLELKCKTLSNNL